MSNFTDAPDVNGVLLIRKEERVSVPIRDLKIIQKNCQPFNFSAFLYQSFITIPLVPLLEDCAAEEADKLTAMFTFMLFVGIFLFWQAQKENQTSTTIETLLKETDGKDKD